MANFLQQHNGRTKIVRNRFGGDNKRPRDYDATVRHRRTRLMDLDQAEQLVETRELLADRAHTARARSSQSTTHEPTATRYCHFAQTDAPINGVLRVDGDSALTLRYEGGKLASAHCRG